ncbi:MAG: hypothetical protein M0P73_16260 [Syntrophobacterales bacterium]|jgi:hypothetical protein|nr:hypothetical protein [Syntrophobacterales bacterium]
MSIKGNPQLTLRLDPSLLEWLRAQPYSLACMAATLRRVETLDPPGYAAFTALCLGQDPPQRGACTTVYPVHAPPSEEPRVLAIRQRIQGLRELARRQPGPEQIGALEEEARELERSLLRPAQDPPPPNPLALVPLDQLDPFHVDHRQELRRRAEH